MSDRPLGPGSWKASDGRWYDAVDHPDYAAPPTIHPPPSQPVPEIAAPRPHLHPTAIERSEYALVPEPMANSRLNKNLRTVGVASITLTLIGLVVGAGIYFWDDGATSPDGEATTATPDTALTTTSTSTSTSTTTTTTEASQIADPPFTNEFLLEEWLSAPFELSDPLPGLSRAETEVLRAQEACLRLDSGMGAVEVYESLVDSGWTRSDAINIPFTASETICPQHQGIFDT